MPTTTTAMAPIPKYWEDRTGPWLPPTTRLMAAPKKPVESAGAGSTKSRTTRAAVGGMEVGPHQAGEVGRSGQGEPARIGQEHAGGDGGRAEAHTGVAGGRPEDVPVTRRRRSRPPWPDRRRP